ncbi:MAG: hypothetical protein JO060_09555, partial [Candidatus Eremiobacteraeota bacterium]|nr:hypothetical protein [Candidatus Eremiobacteraeota bacterium]
MERRIVRLVLVVLVSGTPALALGSTGVVAKGHHHSVLYAFTGGSDGGAPMGRLAFDPAGNLYGTAHFGGVVNCGGSPQAGCGVVFRLTRTHHRWHETPLYAFTDAADGGFPDAGVILDRFGNLYGTASTGGNFACTIGCGVVYELVPNVSQTWSEIVLHSFSGTDGQFPNAALFPGLGGTLYSTAWFGGANGAGTIFSLTPIGSQWTTTVLYSFAGKQDGTGPTGGLAQDPSGKLFGTTYPSNGYNNGVVFELRQGKDQMWRQRVVISFVSGATGENPYAGPIIDSDGTLFGTTIQGGLTGNGVVYEVVHATSRHPREIVLHTFAGAPDGSTPYAGLTLDSTGNLYGATLFGGKHGQGTVFELIKQHPHRYQEKILHDFTGGKD